MQLNHLNLVEPGTPPPDPGSVFHVGFELGGVDAVKAARKRLGEAGARELEWVHEDGYVSFKVADPDGYVVEVYWEQ
ncbi:MAG: VOC family protein [Acidimicrobiales bacterium]